MNSISYEARKLLREFYEFADEKRMRGEFDVTTIVGDYYRDELKPYFEENGHKASLFLKRFVVITKQFVDTDPRYQRRMYEFI